MALLRPISDLPNNSDMVVFVWENNTFGRQIVEGWRDNQGNLQGEYPATKLATHFVDPSEFVYEEDEEDVMGEADDYINVLHTYLSVALEHLQNGNVDLAQNTLHIFATTAQFNAKYGVSD